MANDVTLKAGRREGRGKGSARKLRAAGKVPAVVYGASAEPVAVELDTHDTHILFHSISVENTIVSLDIEGEKAPVQTLVREIQTHPIRPDILHVDFLRIQMDVAVELEVPIHLEGTPRGVRDEGGVLEQPLHELSIRCLPNLIPEEIAVDVAELNIGDSVHVSDLSLPEGVEILTDEERIICSVQVPTVLKVEEPEEGEEGEEAELVGEGDADEDGDAADGDDGEKDEEGDGD